MQDEAAMLSLESQVGGRGHRVVYKPKGLLREYGLQNSKTTASTAYFSISPRNTKNSRVEG